MYYDWPDHLRIEKLSQVDEGKLSFCDDSITGLTSP